MTRRRRSGAIAALLFLVALAPRLVDLRSPSLNTDEVKWIARGERFFVELRAGHFRRATAHLMHPGVPPAAAIGVSQRIAAKWDRNADPVVSARLPSALTGALTPPLLFLAAAPWLGKPVAALGATFLALDPRHLAVSRSAHLDAIFGLLYATVLWGLLQRAAAGRLPAGVTAATALGLAVATRTPGVIAALTWIVFALLQRWRGRRGFFGTTELYLFGLSLAVFLLTYAKVWLPRETIPGRVRYPGFPQAIDAALATLASLGPLVWLAAGGLLAAGILVRRRVAGPLFFGASAILVAAVTQPNLLENLYGFGSNLVTSPRRLHHNYYGGAFSDPVPGRYATILLSGMPLPVLIGLLAGLPLLAWRSWRDSSRAGDAGILCVTAIVVFLVMTLPVSKVAFRYLMPIYPFLMLASAWGWIAASDILPRPAAAGTGAALVLAVGLAVLPEAPYYSAWTSTAGSRLAGALGLRHPFTSEGHDAATEYLWQHAAPGDHVSALCYDDVLAYYWKEVLPRRHHEPPRQPPRIGYFPMREADWVVVSARRRLALDDGILAFLAGRDPVFAFDVGGAVVMEVFDLRTREPTAHDPG